MKRKKTSRRLVVFTDLDGTLLDHDSYNYEAAKPALKLLKKRGIPLIICTSKTRAEIAWWQEKLSIHAPFVSENGGGVFIPQHYFPFPVDADRHVDGLLVRSLGEPVSKLGRVLDELENHYDLIRISKLSDEELGKITGLSREQAARSRKREYDLPFIVQDSGREAEVREEIRKRGFQYTRGGRFSHIIGGSDKGRAVAMLLECFKRTGEDFLSVGIGDSENDFSMLRVTTRGFLVKRPDGSYSSDEFHHAGDRGPRGWNRVILRLVRQMDEYISDGNVF